jgi:cytidylate kinase
MSNKVITISREFGSGGRTVGKMVAEKLGIPCYDQEIIQKIAEESGYCEDFVAEHSEHAAYGNWLSNAFAFRDYYGNSIQDKIWFAQLKTIVELANKGPCVIVGRCADFILKETADCLKVFIHADPKARAERIVEQYGESSQAPERRLKDKDKRRAAYYQMYTDQKWGDNKNYDIALSTSSLGIDTCVDIIVELYKIK